MSGSPVKTRQYVAFAHTGDGPPRARALYARVPSLLEEDEHSQHQARRDYPILLQAEYASHTTHRSEQGVDLGQANTSSSNGALASSDGSLASARPEDPCSAGRSYESGMPGRGNTFHCSSFQKQITVRGWSASSPGKT